MRGFMKSYNSMFRYIGENCNYCFLDEKNRKAYQEIIIHSLAQIMEETKNKEIKSLVESVSKICSTCNYKDPKIFQFLEKKGIKFS